jgi:hypothetical protein
MKPTEPAVLSEIAKGLLNGHLDSFFQDRGFSRRGTDYTRDAELCVQHIFFRFDIRGRVDCKYYYFANLEYPDIEDILSFGERDADSVNTFGKQMGFLRKPFKFDEWSFGKRVDVANLGRKTVEDVDLYAIPFLEEYSNPCTLCDALEKGELFNLDVRDAALKLAVIHHLMGNPHRAIEILRSRIEALEGRPQRYRFTKMAEYLASVPPGSWVDSSTIGTGS